ncbi:MAG: OsmC family protein [Dehalococcoidia bacterium]|nr:OsmC family protein [Dehalococcoidia bacterium]
MSEARGLQHYLRQKRAAMDRAAAERPDGDDWHETVSASCIADDATGVRKLRMRDWQLTGDSGPSFGGWNLGPSSPELLCGVISTCLTHTYLIGAASMEVPVDRVEVRVDAENNDAGFLGIESEDPPLPFGIVARVWLEAPEASDAQREELHRYARERCPLTALVRQPNEVRIEVAEG